MSFPGSVLRRAFPALLAVHLAAGFAIAAQNQNAAAGAWSGIMVSSACDADEAFMEVPDCYKEQPGAKLALLDDTTRVTYEMDAAGAPGIHFGDPITVQGILDDDVIRGASIAPASLGLAVGQKAPPFSLRDQFGREQSLDTLKGAHGTVLLFFRSADWEPYCKEQLVQLQNAIQRFEQQGVKLAAISYDSQEILKFYSDHQKITYPLLADSDSKTIMAYGVINPEAFGMQTGMARPVYFFIDPSGIIREKIFDFKYRNRLTGNSLVAKLFPELGQAVTEKVDAPHLQLTLQQSDPAGVSGTILTVVAELTLPPDVHVFAPGAQGHNPTGLVMDPVPDVVFNQAEYPASKTLFLPAIKESVPAYEGTFRIVQPVQVSTRSDAGGVGKDGKLVTVTGKLEYQACDNTVCFPPASVSVKWQLRVYPLDRTRAPLDIRHK